MSSIEAAELNIRQGNNDAAFKILMELAEYHLSIDVQFALFNMCFDGLLTADQTQELVSWLNRESYKGNGYADYNLGVIYERGLIDGVINYKEAAHFYERAVKEEVQDAHDSLGNIYVTGIAQEQGIPQNVNKGIELLAKGAELGSRHSCQYEALFRKLHLLQH